MLVRYRRKWILAFAAVLIAPLAAHLFGVSASPLPQDEFRVAAKVSLPSSFRDWKRLPRGIDEYLRDNFGLREIVLHTYAEFGGVFGRASNSRVLLGSDGWMFYRGDSMLQQSAGLLVRSDEISETVITLTSISTALASRGSKLVFASPPNSATIYSDKIPGWPKSAGRSTEYDLVFKELIRHGVEAIDLRPILYAARTQGPAYYQQDTHWTPRGAMSAFNAMITASDHGATPLDAASTLGALSMRPGGDLPRMLGPANEAAELAEPLALPSSGNRRELSRDPLVFETTPKGGGGRTILVIGDSFTETLFPAMIAARGARAIWLHHNRCTFDWHWVEELHPDVVWYMPTERLVLCKRGKGPKGLPD